MKRTILILMTALLATPAAAVDALQPGDTINGTLRLVHGKQPNGAPVEAYQIVSDKPLPFEQKVEYCGSKAPKTFQLAVSDNRAKTARLKRNLGKHIAIIADEFMCPEKPSRTGDAEATKWRFASPETR